MVENTKTPAIYRLRPRLNQLHVSRLGAKNSPLARPFGSFSTRICDSNLWLRSRRQSNISRAAMPVRSILYIQPSETAKMFCMLRLPEKIG